MMENSNNSATTPVLEAIKIWKSFGSTVSLADVSVEAHAGRILALLGDNGAGKSTLVKILCGVLTPDEGELRMNGDPIEFSGPAMARERGVATVFQDLAICPLLSITRNVVLGNEPTKGWGVLRRFDAAKARRDTIQALETLGVRLNRELEAPATTLSGGERQALAIAREMFYGSACLILDEPTSALAVRQADKVLEHICAARDKGKAVIFITHNFRHALAISDDIVVLSRGRVMGKFEKEEISLEELLDLVAEEGLIHH